MLSDYSLLPILLSWAGRCPQILGRELWLNPDLVQAMVFDFAPAVCDGSGIHPNARLKSFEQLLRRGLSHCTWPNLKIDLRLGCMDANQNAVSTLELRLYYTDRHWAGHGDNENAQRFLRRLVKLRRKGYIPCVGYSPHEQPETLYDTYQYLKQFYQFVTEGGAGPFA